MNKTQTDRAKAQRKALSRIEEWVQAQITVEKRDEIIVEARAAGVPGPLIATQMGIGVSTVGRAVRAAKEEGRWPGSS